MKQFMYLLVFAFLISSCSKQPQNQMTVTGHIQGGYDGMVYLQKGDKRNYTTIDSARTVNGEFRFSHTVDTAQMYYINYGDQYRINFFSEPQEINITFHKDSSHLAIVKGGLLNDSYNDFQALERKSNEAYSKLYAEYQQAVERNDTATVNALDSNEKVIMEQAKTDLVTFLDKTSDQLVAPYLITRNSWQFELPEMEERYAKLSPEMKQSVYGRQINDRITTLQSVAIGKTAPDFTMNDTEGNPFTLSQLRGQTVLIDFWAAWCPPCRRENPNVVANYNRHKDNGFTVLGVSLDREKEAWLKAIADDNLTWHHVSDIKFWDNAAAKQYGVSSIPSNVLLDKDGVIIARNLTGDDLTHKLNELFVE